MIKALEVPKFHKQLDLIESMTNKGRILDVGCGNGNFLECAKLRDWETYGVDLNPASFEPVSKVAKIFIGTLEEAKFPDEYFDVIFSSSFFCYLTEPLSHLIEVKRILKKQRLAVIAGIPNLKSLDSFLSIASLLKPYPPVQVSYYFDRPHLAELIKHSGLKIRNIESNGFGISLKFILYRKNKNLSLDSNQYESNIDILANAEKNGSINQNRIKKIFKPFINFLLNFLNLGYHFNLYLEKDH